MSDASSEDEIDQLIDQPANCYILNACGWSLTEPIVPSNKLQFLQQLMVDEVLNKRERNLKAFMCGLQVLGIIELVKAHPDLTRQLFVSEKKTMTPECFMKLVVSVCPAKPDERRAFGFFEKYVSTLNGEYSECLLLCDCVCACVFVACLCVCVLKAGHCDSVWIICDISLHVDKQLRKLLWYATGLHSVPPMGLDFPIELKYLPPPSDDEKDKNKYDFPKSNACFSKLSLPTVHDSIEKFGSAFDKALSLGGGFGYS